MKLHICLLVITAFLSACQNFNEVKLLADSSQVLEYQLEDQRYAVVVVQDDGISASRAKKMAKTKAAELTIENGYRYFVIVSEEATQVIKSDQSDNQASPTNIYQELIIQGDFGKESQERRLGRIQQAYPAIRLVFDCYKEKPRGKSMDACSLTHCN
ncbi:MAG: hypothetical protein V4487_04590 [Chlamydiota bacterium]